MKTCTRQNIIIITLGFLLLGCEIIIQKEQDEKDREKNNYTHENTDDENNSDAKKNTDNNNNETTEKSEESKATKLFLQSLAGEVSSLASNFQPKPRNNNEDDNQKDPYVEDSCTKDVTDYSLNPENSKLEMTLEGTVNCTPDQLDTYNKNDVLDDSERYESYASKTKVSSTYNYPNCNFDQLSDTTGPEELPETLEWQEAQKCMDESASYGTKMNWELEKEYKDLEGSLINYKASFSHQGKNSGLCQITIVNQDEISIEYCLKTTKANQTFQNTTPAHTWSHSVNAELINTTFRKYAGVGPVILTSGTIKLEKNSWRGTVKVQDNKRIFDFINMDEGTRVTGDLDDYTNFPAVDPKDF